MRIRYALALALGAISLIVWLIVLLKAHMRQDVDRCPSCRSDRVRPSWPSIIDKILKLPAIGAFRCEACLVRFYARRSLYYVKSSTQA